MNAESSGTLAAIAADLKPAPSSMLETKVGRKVSALQFILRRGLWRKGSLEMRRSVLL
jgi:hypothetical protein